MNETQVRTLELVRQVVDGTEALEFRRCENDQGRYAWIESVLRRFDYRRLPRQDRGLVLAYLQRLSGYIRAQLTRLGLALEEGQAAAHSLQRPRARLCAALHDLGCGVAGGGGAPWARCLARPQPACGAASAMCSVMRVFFAWARSRWRTYTTCATARAIEINASS